MGTGKFSGKPDQMLGGNLSMDKHPIQGKGGVILLGRNFPSKFQDSLMFPVNCSSKFQMNSNNGASKFGKMLHNFVLVQNFSKRHNFIEIP